MRCLAKIVILRHRVLPSASPMTGSSGVSSTPRLFDSITNASEYSDLILRSAPLARASKDGRESLRCVHPSRRLLRKLLRMSSVFFTGAHWYDPLARNDGLMPRSSNRLAEKFRALQPISPRQFDRLGNADPQPRDDVRFCRARVQRDRWDVERQAVVLVGNPKRFRQLARPRAQQSLIMQSTA